MSAQVLANAGSYLSSTLKGRADLMQAAGAFGEEAESFVLRFPKHRLYQMQERTPYSRTTNGALVLIADYKFDVVKASSDPDEEACVKVVMIRDASGKWTTDPQSYWIAPKYMRRVDEAKFGIELET